MTSTSRPSNTDRVPRTAWTFRLKDDSKANAVIWLDEQEEEHKESHSPSKSSSREETSNQAIAKIKRPKSG
jgi:hypothetical protein